MAEEIFSGYDESPQSDTKCQKLLECVLTGNNKLYLGKVYTEDQLAKLSEEEVDKLFNNYELNSQVVTQTAFRPKPRKRNSNDVLSHAPNISHKPKTITHNDKKIALVLSLAGGFAIWNIFR